MAGGAAPKADEPLPHPAKDQLPSISYCITSPPPWREFSLTLSLPFFFLKKIIFSECLIYMFWICNYGEYLLVWTLDPKFEYILRKFLVFLIV